MWGMGILFLLLSLSAFGESQDYERNSLQWPTALSESEFKLGPNLHQYQKFPGLDEYFHEGVDVVGEPFQKIYAPVSGYIDAGYYAYETLPDGSSKKSYISINDFEGKNPGPEYWGPKYFEVSITDVHGNRFEIHHVDRRILPLEIRRAVKENAFILQGVLVGNITPWPNKVLGADYNHIHYSVLSPEGVQLNPYWFSQKIKDTTPPKVSTVYYQLKRSCPESGRVMHHFVSSLKPGDRPTHIIIKAKDLIDENHFPQAPTKISAQFSNGESYKQDFSYSMMVESQHVNIHDLYTDKICLGPKSDVFILKASDNFDFSFKVPLPENFSGTASITFSDFSGNETNTLVNVKKAF